MKILHVIFSTNRINYLEKTLYTQEKYLDFSNLEVHKLLIDDYPLNRDDSIIINLHNCITVMYYQSYGKS